MTVSTTISIIWKIGNLGGPFGIGGILGYGGVVTGIGGS